MIGTEERFIWSSKKVYFHFFVFVFTCKCIFDLYEHRKFEYLSQPSGVYSFVRKFKKINGDESPMGPKEIEVV